MEMQVIALKSVHGVVHYLFMAHITRVFATKSGAQVNSSDGFTLEVNLTPLEVLKLMAPVREL